ncbi:hypothetical protein TrVFT333_003156 [Trichoderma virens FT-333]|nr:hypothetical protein TrVFT333_003156 [Trichoderma virens FT-333]
MDAHSSVFVTPPYVHIHVCVVKILQGPSSVRACKSKWLFRPLNLQPDATNSLKSSKGGYGCVALGLVNDGRRNPEGEGEIKRNFLSSFNDSCDDWDDINVDININTTAQGLYRRLRLSSPAATMSKKLPMPLSLTTDDIAIRARTLGNA